MVGLGAKDAFAHRGRACLTLGSLALAAAVLVCAMGFEATTNRVGTDSALRAQPWDIGVTTSSLAPERVDALLRARPEVAAVARVYETQGVGRGGVRLQLRVLEGPLHEFPFAIRAGHGAYAAGEATFGRAALEDLGVAIGRPVTLTIARRPVTLRAVGRHIEPDNGGLEAVMPMASLPPAVRATLRHPDWAVRLKPGSDAREAEVALADASPGQLDVWRPIESLQRETAKLRPVVYGVSALLLAVALVNLLTTLLLKDTHQHKHKHHRPSAPSKTRARATAGPAAQNTKSKGEARDKQQPKQQLKGERERQTKEKGRTKEKHEERKKKEGGERKKKTTT